VPSYLDLLSSQSVLQIGLATACHVRAIISFRLHTLITSREAAAVKAIAVVVLVGSRRSSSGSSALLLSVFSPITEDQLMCISQELDRVLTINKLGNRRPLMQ